MNSTDALAVAQATGNAPGPPYRTVFDVNKDGRTNSTDQLIVAQVWGNC
ncbi:MAG: hypothetical protein HY874_04860 [Chloroflexi bacterium]|nr:hypothetical protein [Chloroflexota bacterium]